MSAAYFSHIPHDSLNMNVNVSVKAVIKYPYVI